MATRTKAAASRRAAAVSQALATELRHLREDCALSQRSLSSVTGVPQSVISRLEAGLDVPSIETYARLAVGLGANLSIRLYPNTGPGIRDRHQSRIVEALVAAATPTWSSHLEIGVNNPVRGWIDVVLVHRAAPIVVATEIESSLRRMEQLIRWSRAKADAVRSAAGYPFGAIADPTVHRLLIVRDTEANRHIATLLHATLKAAYPADPWHAMAALAGEAGWPNSAMLWARDGRDGRVRLAPSATTRGPSA